MKKTLINEGIQKNIRTRAIENNETLAHVRAVTNVDTRTAVSDPDIDLVGSGVDDLVENVEMEEAVAAEQKLNKHKKMLKKVKKDLEKTHRDPARAMASRASSSRDMPMPVGVPRALGPEDSQEPRGPRGRPRLVQEPPMIVDLEGKGPEKRSPEEDHPEKSKSKKLKDREAMLALPDRERLKALPDIARPKALSDIPRPKAITEGSSKKDIAKTVLKTAYSKASSGSGSSPSKPSGSAGPDSSKKIPVKPTISKDKERKDESPKKGMAPPPKGTPAPTSPTNREHGTKRDTDPKNKTRTYWREKKVGYITDQIHAFGLRPDPSLLSGRKNIKDPVSGQTVRIEKVRKLNKDELLEMLFKHLGI